ncbi:hypothetical protein ACH24_02820 [Francisella persica ATCC VR-331]|uniref:Uncharacterized protein n=1 Tax=Francisella persica ATCC VR-331 TaxID=1086726 RepID=A0AAC8VDL2_9GAMM|nr:hypothetical protein [Francisella persica]ALB01661.1 hypothetical protein ACH24_02820 [Francisella persica ATCC VR-331]ANH77960.1 hypothetical protein FSC845_05645 [Francisella persica ATCC VR-331]
MKKIVLTGFMLAFGVSSSLAMSYSKPIQSPAQKQYADNTHKLVDIYSKDNKNSKVSAQITFENQDNYNIFYCKQNTIKRLEEYAKVQDQKIAKLYAMIMQMQQDFTYALEQQQAQINQLKQAYYY